MLEMQSKLELATKLLNESLIAFKTISIKMSQFSTTLTPGMMCEVIKDYEGKFYDEIDLKIGEKVKVIEETEPGWWKGEVEGKVGRVSDITVLYYGIQRSNNMVNFIPQFIVDI